MCLDGKAFGSKMKEWVRVQLMEPASLTPRLCFPKQKEPPSSPRPDAFIDLQVTCVQGVLCPCPCLSDSPGLLHGPRPKPTRRLVLYASVHLSRREDGLWSQSPGSRPGSTPSQLGTHKHTASCASVRGAMAGQMEGGDADDRNCLSAWSPPSWFSLASGHYHYSMGHIHESVLETDVAALRLQSVRYYYLCPKY